MVNASDAKLPATRENVLRYRAMLRESVESFTRFADGPNEHLELLRIRYAVNTLIELRGRIKP